MKTVFPKCEMPQIPYGGTGNVAVKSVHVEPPLVVLKTFPSRVPAKPVVGFINSILLKYSAEANWRNQLVPPFTVL
jgi:hypothetical protein